MKRLLLLTVLVLSLAAWGYRTWGADRRSDGRASGLRLGSTERRLAGPQSLPEKLRVHVRRFEREPTDEAAADVWESFSEVGERIAALKRIVRQTAGGARAEAEIERIELEHLYGRESARFAALNARLQSAQRALDALASASDSAEGVQAAAEILVHSTWSVGGGVEGSRPAMGLGGVGEL